MKRDIATVVSLDVAYGWLAVCGGGGGSAAPRSDAAAVVLGPTPVASAPATPPASSSVPVTPTIPTAATLSGFTRLVWSDEFNVDGLPDSGKWGYDTDRNHLLAQLFTLVLVTDEVLKECT